MELTATKYKETEVGLIPEDWEVKALVDIGEIATGTTPPTSNKNNYGEDYFFVSPADLGKGKYIIDTEKKLSKLGFSLARKYPSNSILFTCIGSTIGKAGISKIELSSNQQINAVFPNDLYSSDFLFYYLNFISPKIKLGASEQAVPMINKTEFGKTLIAFPFKPEQKAIAQVLSDTDALIQAIEKKITKKKLIKKGVMQELLKPKENWLESLISSIGQPYGGMSGKTKADFSNGNAYYVPFMNVMSNPITDIGCLDSVNIKKGESQNKILKGDLLFNGSSETPEEVGFCSAVLEQIDNLYLNSFCFGFRIHNAKQFDSLFLAYFFRSTLGRKFFYSLAQGATRYNLSKTNFLKSSLALPIYEDQVKIASIIRDIDSEISQLENQLSKYQLAKQGMMQQLLTGKIRLG